jgi:hypothetical protein
MLSTTIIRFGKTCRMGGCSAREWWCALGLRGPPGVIHTHTHHQHTYSFTAVARGRNVLWAGAQVDNNKNTAHMTPRAGCTQAVDTVRLICGGGRLSSWAATKRSVPAVHCPGEAHAKHGRRVPGGCVLCSSAGRCHWRWWGGVAARIRRGAWAQMRVAHPVVWCETAREEG